MSRAARTTPLLRQAPEKALTRRLRLIPPVPRVWVYAFCVVLVSCGSAPTRSLPGVSLLEGIRFANFVPREHLLDLQVTHVAPRNRPRRSPRGVQGVDGRYTACVASLLRRNYRPPAPSHPGLTALPQLARLNQQPGIRKNAAQRTRS